MKKINVFLSTFFALTNVFIFPRYVSAHDLQGLLATQNQAPKIQKKISAREEIRNKKQQTPTQSSDPEAVVAVRALWPQYWNIAVCFVDGTKEAQLEVMKIAKEIYQDTNLVFDPAAYQCPKKEASIRISFREKGYWSYVGTDALLIKAPAPTMGLSNLDKKIPLSENEKGVIRHEFMHSLGALHEHQHPNADCENQLNWDKAANLLGWSSIQMKTNFLQLIKGPDTISTKNPDKKSCMYYQLSPALWKTGTDSSCYIKYSNNECSEEDKKMISQQYPK